MIKEVVDRYLEIYPEDRPKLKRLIGQLVTKESLDDRRNFNGHIAGDAIIFSPDFKKVLLIYHKRYAKWHQPGGHFDPGEDGPWGSAEREAEEETGLQGLVRVSVDTDYRVPIHIATGDVPGSEAKNEPDHWHHDFRYGFIATSEDLPPVDDSGVGGVEWYPLDQVADKGGFDFGTSIDRLSGLLSLKA